MWVDVEDQSAKVDPVEVDDFPTLLIAVGHEVRFFGPMIPRSDPLERMVRGYLTQADVPMSTAAITSLNPEANALLHRLLQ